MNSKITYQPGLDGLRAFAVSIVVLWHLGVPYVHGTLGVDIFFVLSGFLITNILIRDSEQRRPLAEFYLRRWLRLFPALFVLCATLLAISAHFANLSQSVADVFASVTYVTNWTRAFRVGVPVYLSNTWSLSLEEQFYILWGLLFPLVMRQGGPKTVGLIAIFLTGMCMAWRTYLLCEGARFGRVYLGFDTHCDGLLLGCALAALYRLSPFGYLSMAARVLWVPAVGLMIYFIFVTGWSPAVAPAINLCAGIIILAICLLPTSALAIALSVRPAVYIGRISYGIYLWHYPIGIVLLNLFVPQLIRQLVILPATVVIAALSYHFVERRFLQLRYALPLNLTTKLGRVALTATCVSLCVGVCYFFADDIRQIIEPTPLIIDAYGPHELKAGSSFNLQPDGRSVMWIMTSHMLPTDVSTTINGVPVESNVRGKLMEVNLPRSVRATVGKKVVVLYHSGKVLVQVEFTVIE
jgi:peptidoglycan/LPS O-acetylase OafA/YrhL